MFYYSVVIASVIYFLLKPFSKKLFPFRLLYIKIHLFILALSATDLLLIAIGWRFAGAYTTLILCALTICTGIICARFFIDEATGRSLVYFKVVRGFTILFVVVGIIPVFSGYGSGFVKNILNIEYTNYPTGQGYVYRSIQQGARSCKDLHLYQQFLFIEREIPVTTSGDSLSDCFNPLRFTIVKANRDTIVAEAKFWGVELEYFTLDKRNKRLSYESYKDGYTLINHEIEFGCFSYLRKVTATHIEPQDFVERLALKKDQYGYIRRFGNDLLKENPEDSDMVKTLDSVLTIYK